MLSKSISLQFEINDKMIKKHKKMILLPQGPPQTPATDLKSKFTNRCSLLFRIFPEKVSTEKRPRYPNLQFPIKIVAWWRPMDLCSNLLSSN